MLLAVDDERSALCNGNKLIIMIVDMERIVVANAVSIVTIVLSYSQPLSIEASHFLLIRQTSFKYHNHYFSLLDHIKFANPWVCIIWISSIMELCHKDMIMYTCMC